MKRPITTLFSLFLTIFLLMVVQSVTALGMGICTINGIRYGVNGTKGTATVLCSLAAPYSGEVIIPPVIRCNGQYYTVTAIDEMAFLGASRMTFIELPETLINIGDSAFRGCSELVSITIPDSVERIGDYGFCGCLNLRYIYFGENPCLQHIGSCAFFDCWRLCRLALPATLQTMGLNPFGQTGHCSSSRSKPKCLIDPQKLEDDVFYPQDPSDADATFSVSPWTSPTISTEPLWWSACSNWGHLGALGSSLDDGKGVAVGIGAPSSSHPREKQSLAAPVTAAAPAADTTDGVSAPGGENVPSRKDAARLDSTSARKNWRHCFGCC